jgi:TonB family protein
MIARSCLRWRGERLLLLLVTIFAVSLRPTLGSGEENPPAKPPAKKAPTSQPSEEKAAPPAPTLTPAQALPSAGSVSAPPASVPPAPTLPPPAPASDARRRPAPLAIEGAYSTEGGAGQMTVKHIYGDFFQVTGSNAWEGVGILDGSIYRGVFRHRDRMDIPGGAMGEQTIDWSDPENPRMQATYTIRREGQVVQRWRRVPDSGGGPALKPPPPAKRPAFGEYVYVEELPEAVTKVPPVYPDEARKAGVEGVVLVQVLVVEDGTVADYRIVNSVPGLDDVAVACVRQWRFKPALSAGKPVAVWVAVPIRFSLR